MNDSVCQSWVGGIPDPPTTSATCAIAIYSNTSAILKSCCHNAPMATYGENLSAPYTCFQYCNITDPGLTWQDVQTCISNASKQQNQNLTELVCGPGYNNTTGSSKNGTDKIRGNLGRMILGLAIAAVMIRI